MAKSIYSSHLIRYGNLVRIKLLIYIYMLFRVKTFAFLSGDECIQLPFSDTAGNFSAQQIKQQFIACNKI